jgi:hypothetical protein
VREAKVGRVIHSCVTYFFRPKESLSRLALASSSSLRFLSLYSSIFLS